MSFKGKAIKGYGLDDYFSYSPLDDDNSRRSGHSSETLRKATLDNTLSKLDYDHEAQDAWQKVVDSAKIEGAIPIEFVLSPPLADMFFTQFPLYMVRIKGTVPSVTDMMFYGTKIPGTKGMSTAVQGDFTIPRNLHKRGEKAMLEFLLDGAKSLYMHEAAEQFVVMKDGVVTRPFDPHKVSVSGMVSLPDTSLPPTEPLEPPPLQEPEPDDDEPEPEDTEPPVEG
jgi:hypothetical protein